MNPNNNQQPYYQYHQTTQGPAPPSWQAPPRNSLRWGDPRPSQPSPVVGTPNSPYGTAPGQLPIPPPPPIPPGGIPGNPLTGASNTQQYDTSGWGVRQNQTQQFNQAQDNSQRPALPPRPTSSQPGSQYGWQGQISSPAPPVPPPRPAEYAVPQLPQNQYFPHETISTRPSSQRYEPPHTQNQNQSQSNVSTGWQIPQSFHDAPVSPIDNRSSWQKPPAPAVTQPYTYQPTYSTPRPTSPSRPLRTSIPAPSASALGSGGPSDWQHYPGDAQSHNERTDFTSQTQLHPHSRHGSLAYTITPEQTHATPAYNSPGNFQQGTETPPKTVTPLSQGRYSPHSTPQIQYSGGHSGQSYSKDSGRPSLQSNSGKSGSIDSVMNAWNTTTVQDSAVQPLRTTRPSSTAQDTLARNRSTANVQTQTDFPPIVKTETKIETKYETREIDPYEDLKNEYRTSLNRYATMLRQEMALSSEKDKMMLVCDFVNREVKLRAVLFSAEPAELVRSAELAELRGGTTKARSEVTSVSEKLRLEEQLRKVAELELAKVAERATRDEQLRKDVEKQLEDLKKATQKQIEDIRSTADKQIEDAKKAADAQIEEHKQMAEKAKAESAARTATDLPSQRQPSPSARSVTPMLPTINTDATASNAKDDGFVVINADGGDDAEYSPGGRPRVSQPSRVAAHQRSMTPANVIATQKTQPPVVGGFRPSSPASNAPMTLDDYNTGPQSVNATQPNRSFNATPVQTATPANTAPHVPPKIGSNQTPIAFQPPRPAYTPFQYNQGVAPTPLMLNGNSTADQAYSKLRYEQNAESGRLLNQAPPTLTVSAPDRTQSATPSRARQQHEEAFIGLLRSQSKAVRRPQTVPPPPSGAPAPLRAGTPMARGQSLPPLVKAIEGLRQNLPTSLPQLRNEKHPHPLMEPLTARMASIVDDFSYIKGTVIAWDKSNRQVRQKLDAERANRESENEAHIDQLFNENEIGYADVAGLEDDFKVEEAGKKYDEDQAELESFSKSVFEVVSARLEHEIADLDDIRNQVLDILQFRSQCASDCLRTAAARSNNATEKVSLAETMSVMLQLHAKIDVRQTKLAEAKFERERRRKRLELSVLYTNGDTAGVKQLEDDFDHAQSMQVYSEAQKRDDRASKLMDSFDPAVVQGLADNQEWIDEMANKATLLRDLVLGAESNGLAGRDREELLYGPAGVREILDSLSNAITMVNQDSKELVDLSTQADKNLNEATFAMMLADTKTANRDQKEYEQLKEEKVKEDVKIKEEYENRVNSVQKGPNEIFNSIKEVRDKIGSDPEHETRINQALERARERNQSPI